MVTYQEQVIRIGREVGDLSWSDASALRNAMSKSLGKETFDKYGAKWKVGALAKGIPQAVVDKVWDDLCSYGSWAFNKSHAVAYGIVSYYCCWLKAHHPVEFAAATLSHTETIETQIEVLREMHAEGIDYVPVDAELSVANWTVGYRDNKKILIGPLSSVKGIGPKIMSQILSAKARGEPLAGRALKLLSDPKTAIDDLWPIESRLKVIVPDLSARNIFTPPTLVKKVQPNGEIQEVVVLCTPSQINPRDENEPTNIKKRGYEMKGPTAYLNLRLTDDTDTIFAKISRFDYATLAEDIVNRGRPGKALYAIKGQVPKDFRMISVKQVKYLGDMEEEK